MTDQFDALPPRRRVDQPDAIRCGAHRDREAVGTEGEGTETVEPGDLLTRGHVEGDRRAGSARVQARVVGRELQPALADAVASREEVRSAPQIEKGDWRFGSVQSPDREVAWRIVPREPPDRGEE